MEFETKYVSTCTRYEITRGGKGDSRYRAVFYEFDDQGLEELGFFAKLPDAKRACKKHQQPELPETNG